jgi:DNA-binding transcriptional regulator YdaS (Cro superfamily)
MNTAAPPPVVPLDAVIAIVGSGAELARRLGVNKTAISQWRKREIPVKRARDVSRISGIPLHELRPDVWADPRSGAV